MPRSFERGFFMGCFKTSVICDMMYNILDTATWVCIVFLTRWRAVWSGLVLKGFVMNDSGTGAEFRVRSSWACLITTGLIYPVLIATGLMWGWNGIVLAVMLGFGIALQAVVLVLVHLYLALAMPDEPDDERDRMLLKRASSIAGYVLQSGVFCVLVLMFAMVILKMVGSEGREGTGIEDMLPIFALLGVWIASEMVRYALTITGYKSL